MTASYYSYTNTTTTSTASTGALRRSIEVRGRRKGPERHTLLSMKNDTGERVGFSPRIDLH